MLRKSDLSLSRVTYTLTDSSIGYSVISSFPVKSETGKSGMSGSVLWLFPPDAGQELCKY